MSSSTIRLGTANVYDATLSNLLQRQSSLSSLQEQVSAGKRVIRASDDPAAAVQAERANTRIERVATEQRALMAQRNVVAMTESTLGDATAALQNFRELVVQAGNGTLSPSDHVIIAKQLQQLRGQLLGLANTADSNGLPVFGGLGSSPAPFVDTPAGVVYQGNAGQQGGSAVAVPYTADGQAAWMNVPTGNGSFTVSLGGGNTGHVSTDTGLVANSAVVTGYDYTVTFSGAAGATTYTVTNNTPPASISAAAPFVEGQPISFGGLSLTATGTPANGDQLDIKPSATSGPGTGLFGAIDSAIAGQFATGSTSVGAPSGSPAMLQSISRALTEIDYGMQHIQAARAQAGTLLNQADSISGSQDSRTIQLQADRSRAEDIDMVQGISDLQKQQTGYQVALQSYAQIQKLSLFNYLG
jgi:flagellar hook-associated protein 3 FlgL